MGVINFKNYSFKVDEDRNYDFTTHSPQWIELVEGLNEMLLDCPFTEFVRQVQERKIEVVYAESNESAERFDCDFNCRVHIAETEQVIEGVKFRLTVDKE